MVDARDSVAAWRMYPYFGFFSSITMKTSPSKNRGKVFPRIRGACGKNLRRLLGFSLIIVPGDFTTDRIAVFSVSETSTGRTLLTYSSTVLILLTDRVAEYSNRVSEYGP